jgi:hypothetical protein
MPAKTSEFTRKTKTRISSASRSARGLVLSQVIEGQSHLQKPKPPQILHKGNGVCLPHLIEENREQLADNSCQLPQGEKWSRYAKKHADCWNGWFRGIDPSL